MPTLRQKKVAKKIVENLQSSEQISAGELLKNEGYGKSLQNHPKRVLESEGVQEELRETYGFDPERAKKVVGQILEEGENDNVKLKAAEMIFKVHGIFAAEKHVNVNIDQGVDSKLDALIAQIEDGLDNPQGSAISP